MRRLRFVVAAGSAMLVALASAASGANSAGRLVFMTGSTHRDARWYVANAEGTGWREIRTFAAVSIPLALSPDGTRVAYVCGRALCVRAVGATRARVVVRSSPGSQIHAFDWSPDSRRLAFVRGSALWRVDASGAGQRRLARLPGARFTVSWSPQGSYFALRLIPLGSARTVLYVARADGSGLRRIAVDTGIASWSHDERFLAFGTDETRNEGPVNGFIEVVDVHTRRRTRLVRGSQPVYSPVDGRLLARRYDADGDATLFVVNENGRARRLYTFSYVPVWSPNGREIADAGRRGVFAVDVRTGRRRTIARLPEDGRVVLFLDWVRGR